MIIDKNVHRGEIYLVDFKKNEGSEQNGVRPALVVQNDVGNLHSPTTIVCPLTTQLKNMNATHLQLFPDECGILKTSYVLCEQIRAIDKSRIKRRIGSVLSLEKMKKIDKKIMISFGINQLDI